MRKSLILDTGALIAYERGDRRVALAIAKAVAKGRQVVTSSGCVAQAWRKGGPKQARLARLLRHTDEVALGPEASRSVGALCEASKTSDIIDAHVVLLLQHGDTVLTSDMGDLARLLAITDVRVALTDC